MLKTIRRSSSNLFSLVAKFQSSPQQLSTTATGKAASSANATAAVSAHLVPDMLKPTTIPLQRPTLHLGSSGQGNFQATPDHFKLHSKFASYVHHGSTRTPVISSLMDLTDSTSSLSLLPRRRLHGNPYETLSIKSGDDAMIVSPNLVGVADGVSGWEKCHANSGLFARCFLENMSRNFSELSCKHAGQPHLITESDLRVQLDNAYEESLKVMHNENYKGSSTLVAGMIVDRMLKIVNIGDSRIFVIRHGEIVECNTEQYFANLCPQQVGTQEASKRPSEIAQFQDFELEQDDLILVCTDGVTDNLYPDEILKLINDKVNIDKTNLQEVCNALLLKVKQTAFDNYCATPYVEKVNELSHSFITGGKLDDTSICLSKVLLND